MSEYNVIVCHRLLRCHRKLTLTFVSLGLEFWDMNEALILTLSPFCPCSPGVPEVP